MELGDEVICTVTNRAADTPAEPPTRGSDGGPGAGVIPHRPWDLPTTGGGSWPLLAAALSALLGGLGLLLGGAVRRRRHAGGDPPSEV